MTITFQYHPDILERFPNTVGGVIIAKQVYNTPTPEALASASEAEQNATLVRLGKKSFTDFDSLAAWRAVFREFGVDPTQYRSAPEALLRRLRKEESLPTINMLVDIGNMISIRYGLPVAVFDLRDLTGALTVRFADGTENFTPLGGDAVEHPQKGEVIFVDDANLVFARRWCWRQSAQSAARDSTRRALIVVEAQHEGGREDVEMAVNDIKPLLEAGTTASFVDRVLSVERRRLSIDPDII